MTALAYDTFRNDVETFAKEIGIRRFYEFRTEDGGVCLELWHGNKNVMFLYHADNTNKVFIIVQFLGEIVETGVLNALDGYRQPLRWLVDQSEADSFYCSEINFAKLRNVK